MGKIIPTKSGKHRFMGNVRHRLSRMTLSPLSFKLLVCSLVILVLSYQSLYMLFRNFSRTSLSTKEIPFLRLRQISQHIATASNPNMNGASNASNGRNGPTTSAFQGVSLSDLSKSNVFTSNLPADARFPAPEDSYNATRKDLGPRMVKNALFTYVRPEEKQDPELYGVSLQAMEDIGLKAGEKDSKEFRELMAGNRIMWDPEKKEGIYPWAQCYGGKTVFGC